MRFSGCVCSRQRYVIYSPTVVTRGSFVANDVFLLICFLLLRLE